MMGRILESTSSFGLMALFLLGNFPGGTLVMAASCNTHHLSGWDWLLSILIPFFGLIKGVAC
jgi:hypothetical protein